jgi:hypothetical protein
MDEIKWYGKTLSPDFKEVRIVVISDLHYGNPYYSQKHFQRTLDYIQNNDNVFCFLNGDLCEAITKDSKGDIYKQTVEPKMQRNNVTEMLEPIKDKILAMTTGNHESRIREIDISEDIAKCLNIPYRAEGVLYKLSFGSGNESHKNAPYVFWGYLTHGYGGARTKSAKAVKVERVSTYVHSDFYVMSHDHVVNVAPDIYLIPDNRGIEKNGVTTGVVHAKRKMLIKSNAYLKWGGYSEFGGFPPTDLTTPVISLLTPKSDYWSMYPEKPHQGVKVSV